MIDFFLQIVYLIYIQFTIVTPLLSLSVNKFDKIMKRYKIKKGIIIRNFIPRIILHKIFIS